MRVAKALIFDGDGKILVLRRSGTHPTHAYEPDLPGGIIEDGESYEKGLAREIREETGMIVDDTLLKLVSRNGVGPYQKRIYEVRLTNRPDVTISWEHDAFEWVSSSDGENASHPEFIRFLTKYQN